MQGTSVPWVSPLLLGCPAAGCRWFWGDLRRCSHLLAGVAGRRRGIVVRRTLRLGAEVEGMQLWYRYSCAKRRVADIPPTARLLHSGSSK
jgi:hypothetical protein